MSCIKKFRIIKFKSKPILAVKSISKSFDKRSVLRKIDIHLNKGEMLGLLGSNGAGKSTFMNIVLGLLKCDFGDIFLNNIRFPIGFGEKLPIQPNFLVTAGNLALIDTGGVNGMMGFGQFVTSSSRHW